MSFVSQLPPALVLKYLLSRKTELSNWKMDPLTFRTVVHKIRGNAATFGMPKLGLLAGQIEDSILKNSEEFVTLEPLVSQLQSEVDSQIFQISVQADSTLK